MKESCFYKLFTRIDDKSKLAFFFNEVLSKLDIIRIFSCPTTFEKLDKGIALRFYEGCLWEMYFHKVVSKLNHWNTLLYNYFTEYEGSWKYYASSKRLELIKEYGGEDSDYDSSGNIRTLNLSTEDLKHYTIVSDMIPDDWEDIAQETKPEHLETLCISLKVEAKTSLTDIFKKSTGQELTMYKEENGKMVPMTFADKALSQASDEAFADGYSALILYVCKEMQFIIERIKGLDKFKDNKEELESISVVINDLLNLKIKMPTKSL